MSILDMPEFQLAAVNTSCDRLTDRSGSRRFLLADEVGLGKTIVARRVLLELLRRRRNRDLVVVYLCSNSEIADQNRRKLDPDAGKPIRRITQLAYDERPDGELKLYSFTPGTSLSEGTGLAWERRLLLYLVHRVLRQNIRREKWREYFRCGAGPETWKDETRFRALRNEFSRKLTVELQSRIANEWRNPVALDGGTMVPLQILPDQVDSFQADDFESRRRRNRIVGILRTALQRVLIDDLKPDLVILDEVQRFREVIKAAGSTTSIAARLFDKGAAVLILSATPYRMLSLDHENESHYDEFLDTVRFLYGERGNDAVENLRKALAAFRIRLESGEFLKTPNDEPLLSLKKMIQDTLRQVMSRTERNWYIEEHGKGVEEHRPSASDFAIPRREELVDFIALRRFLLDKVDTTQHVTEYWKSCPAPFTFMDAQYVPMAATRKRNAVIPAGVVVHPSKLAALAQRNLRFRELFRLVFGEENTSWKFLWTRPTYTYYRDEFFGDSDPSKVLVFSGWRFVPKAIALLTSHEAERRIASRGLWEGDDRPPLRFTEKGSFHIFDVCYPSPALASLIEPAAFADNNLTAKELLRKTRAVLKAALRNAGVEIGDTNRTSVWHVIARLEAAHGGSIAGALEKSDSYRGDDVTDRFAEHVDSFVEWANDTEPLRISEKRLTHIARIVMCSPGVALLRAFWSVYPESKGTVPSGVVDLCFGNLRSYFNRKTVRAIVEQDSHGSRSYARTALEYCERAHFQAVIDEYLYLMKDGLQRTTPAEAADHLSRVFGLGTGTPNINWTTATGRIRGESLPRRSHLALAFGDDPSSDAGSPLESQASRKTAVREAFNSPFWPFVLATTSVGQEGLDFHLFCRDVVHWNLPSNPVDLEQREGRINRRDGLAIRRSIRKEWPVERIAKVAPDANTNFWHRVFGSIATEPGIQRYKHGLYPHWVFDPEEGQPERIRRHLFFYADSQDASRYEELKERLALYRLVFGQPRQQDLLERIGRNLQNEGDRQAIHRALTRYMINLSALQGSHAIARSREEAAKLVKSATELERLLLDVDRIERLRRAELEPVATELTALRTVIRTHLEGNGGVPTRAVRLAVEGLVYLRDPFDALLDQHIGLGLEDDCERIRQIVDTIGALGLAPPGPRS